MIKIPYLQYSLRFGWKPISLMVFGLPGYIYYIQTSNYILQKEESLRLLKFWVAAWNLRRIDVSCHDSWSIWHGRCGTLGRSNFHQVWNFNKLRRCSGREMRPGSCWQKGSRGKGLAVRRLNKRNFCLASVDQIKAITRFKKTYPKNTRMLANRILTAAWKEKNISTEWLCAGPHDSPKMQLYFIHLSLFSVLFVVMAAKCSCDLL